MAGEWPVQRLPNLLTLQRGHDLAADKRIDGEFPVIAASGQVGVHNEAKCDAPGVVIGRSGSIGGAQWIEEPFWPLNTTLYVIDFKGNNPYFCYSVLKSIDFQRFNAGSGVPTLNRNHLADIEVPAISRAEQDGIANLLYTLEAKIDLNRQMATTLEDMARALFRSWFVDFDPVRAKAEGRDTGLPAHIAALFPDGLDEDGLPKGWVKISYRDACKSIYSGGTPATGRIDFWGGGIPWLSSGETRSHFVVATEKSISELGVEGSSTRLAPAMATVVATAGQGSTRGQASILGIDTYINQSTAALVANNDLVSEVYLYADLSGRYEELRAISDSQSSRGSLTTKLLADLMIVFPTPSVMATFTTMASTTFERIFEIERTAQTLTEMRHSLLPRLLSGELRVDNAAASIAAA